jgi:methyl-accepting chemotaxis protein
MWGQRNSKYTTAVGVQLLAKIHCLESQLRDVSRLQNHPVDRLQEQTDLVGDAMDRVGRVVDEANERVNLQDAQINQLADMVNDLVGRSEKQAVEIKNLKADRETHHKVINTLTAKVIALEECVEDVQKKAFPQVRELDS